MQDPQALHRHLTPEIVKSVLQTAGYRVQVETSAAGSILTSATGGLPFEIRLFNPLTVTQEGAAAGDRPEGAEASGFADMTFRAAFRVEGELPLSIVNAWNVTHRFARLALAGEWLLLDMDVIALGGLPADTLRIQVEIWDRLVADLIVYLRAELPKLAKAAPVAEPLTERGEAKADSLVAAD